MVRVFTIILAIAAFVLLVSAIFILSAFKKKQRKLYLSIVRLFLCGFVSSIAYIVAISTKDLKAAELGYAAYFASIDWLLLSMMSYSRNYTKMWLDNSTTPIFAGLFAILDNISLLTNIRWHHAFVLNKYEIGDGDWFYVFQTNDFYYVHLAFSYIIVILIVALFVRKSFYAGSFQRGRYLSVLFMFLGIIALDGVFLAFKFPIDIAVIFYLILALAVGYFSVAYNPRAFVEYMLSTITERMDCALIAFDETDSCIYTNQFASRIFATAGNKKILDEWFRRWKDGREVNTINNCTWNDIYNVNGEDLRFDIHFNKVYDKKGYFCGCYFSYYDITSDYIAFEEEKYRSSHDPLTGALNRESFYEEVRILLDTYPTVDYVMVCSDIRGFKLINDMFGLDVADRILIKIADVIRSRIQSGSAFARLEADRFAVIMPKERYSEELIMTGIKEVEYVLNNSQYRMNIQVGVYDIFDRSATITSMCDRAFMAIDSIRSNFKDQIAYYGDMLRNEYMNEQKIIGEFENALSEGQFAMFLQPIVNPEGKLEIAEALVRWVHPEKGIVSPGAFVPVLESTGYIYKLDIYIWEQAVKRLAFWKARGREDLSISVNISVKDFYYVDIFDTLVSLVEKYNINPEKLKLEITESVFMTEKDRQIEIINSLKDYGFLIEIDDFGSGYSSLNMLKEVPANILKIDMAFLSVAGSEEKGKKIINTVIALAKALDMRVVIEGVESESQATYMIEAGCDLLQGYYYDMPISIKKFEEKYL